MRFAALLLLFCAWSTQARDLDVKFEWKILDFEYPDSSSRDRAIASRAFIPENNIPVGLEVWEDKLFVTVPRWKIGVPSSLNYIKMTDQKSSPKLIPYPNWAAHSLTSNSTDRVVSPFRIRADACDRLWVLDTGVNDVTGRYEVLATTSLIIFDLKTDRVIRRYQYPKSQLKELSFFGSIAVDVEASDCSSAFAYTADLLAYGLVVYDLKRNLSWRVEHNYFHSDPLSGDYNVAGTNFQWTDGLFGLALSRRDAAGFKTLYFHPFSSLREFSVSTSVLRNPSLADKSFHNFTVLGERAPHTQSCASFLDEETGILFYTQVNLNAIGCWNTNNKKYTQTNQGRLSANNVTMVFPNDIKVDRTGNIWVFTDRMPVFLYSNLDYNDVNFRVLSAPAKELVKDTVCAQEDLVSDRFGEDIQGSGNSGGTITCLYLALFAAVALNIY